MNRQGKKMKATSQRSTKIRASREEVVRNIYFSKTGQNRLDSDHLNGTYLPLPTSGHLSQTEEAALRRISDLKLQNDRLVSRNEELTQENYLLRTQLQQCSFLHKPQTTVQSTDEESDDTTRSAKRHKESKGKKQVHYSDNEEEKKGKEFMKMTLKTLPPELNLRDDKTFKDNANIEICEKLVSRLQKEMKPSYDLSNKQVETWLKAIHKSRRNAYMKSNSMNIDG